MMRAGRRRIGNWILIVVQCSKALTNEEVRHAAPMAGLYVSAAISGKAKAQHGSVEVQRIDPNMRLIVTVTGLYQPFHCTFVQF